MVLPNGNILTGDIGTPQTRIYNVATNTWSDDGHTPVKLRSAYERSDEEGWAKLPDNSILAYDVFASIATGVSTAQRYIPATNSWVDAGVLPVQLSSASVGYELGPNVLLPDGQVFIIGANGNTALYNPSSNTWTAGPVIPGGYGADDDQAAILPNGHVLFAADIPLFNPPTQIFDYDPVANTITQVSTPDTNLANYPSYGDHMLMLPTGQVLFTDASNQLWVYTPDGSPQASWQPTILGLKANTDGSFTLQGRQLNGMDAGATYGDDGEMDSNYPIVILTNTGNGNVSYARTYGWSTTGVATGAQLETVNFQLPAGLPAGTYSVTESGAGYNSANSVSLTVKASPNLMQQTTILIAANARKGTPAPVQVFASALNPTSRDIRPGLAQISSTPDSVRAVADAALHASVNSTHKEAVDEIFAAAFANSLS
jgi:hypothetical protein